MSIYYRFDRGYHGGVISAWVRAATVELGLYRLTLDDLVWNSPDVALVDAFVFDEQRYGCRPRALSITFEPLKEASAKGAE